MRRAARHGKLLNVEGSFLWKIVDTVVHENEFQYPELREKESYIVSVIRNEEENFDRTIDSGMAIFRELLEAHKAKGETVFSGADAFRLYDTFGFPLDLTIEMSADEGMTVDEGSFKALMEEQRIRAREARKALGDLGWAGVEFGKDIPDTEFVGYDTETAEGKVLAIVSDGEQVSELQEGQEAILVLDKTALYAEMGGQEADHGKISAGDALFTVYLQYSQYRLQWQAYAILRYKTNYYDNLIMLLVYSYYIHPFIVSPNGFFLCSFQCLTAISLLEFA